MEILIGTALAVLIFMGIGSIGKGNGTDSPGATMMESGI